MENQDLQEEINHLVEGGSASDAAVLLGKLWREQPGLAVAEYIVSKYQALRRQLPLVSFRLAILRSFTVEPLVPLLRAASLVAGIELSIHLGEFNAYAQEILGEGSTLYRFDPDAVLLAAHTRDVVPQLWHEYTDLGPEEVAAAESDTIKKYQDCITAFRNFSRASLIVHTLELPAWPSQGSLDYQSDPSQTETLQRINVQIRRLARRFNSVYVLDYDSLVARHGRCRWADETKWLMFRLPVASSNLMHLVNEWLRYLHPMSGRTAKVLAVDLDNTIWGGIIGEDGLAGIKVGPEYPGAAYQALQRVMLDFHRRGILLAVCSKNNPDEALEVIDRHPGMLLRRKHFASMRINWKPKTQNLREIATELNVGTEALAFLDDNPVEREQMNRALPEVWIIDPGADPMSYGRMLKESPVFERLTLSKEDTQRGEYYAAERQRAALRQGSMSPEGFLHSLGQHAKVSHVEPFTLGRVAQLTQKTNQFNLTTRRYTEQQIQSLSERPDWQVLSLQVRDRFCDNGLVGVAIVHDDQETRKIDTFLLSCRVIGRMLDTAFLAYLTQQAKVKKLRFLTGVFLPTKKNAPAQDFYRKHGFQCVEENQERTVWRLDLAIAGVQYPSCIELEGAKNE